MDPLLPETIGEFRILRRLGEGATGVVYLGERMQPFSQRAAIKVLRPSAALLADPGAFQHEERVLTSLDHPAIVRLLDKGESGAGAAYLVMEYVEGVPLDAFCEQTHATQAERVRLMIQVAEACDYAHRHLVIHGDLKPGNVLVDTEANVRLLDFGVATFAGDSLLDSTSDSPQGHTPAYASPEQLAGGRVTPAADVYALGMLLKQVLRNSPQVGDLAAIASMATRVHAEERYRSAAAFAGDLKAWLAHLPVQARRQGRLYRLKKWIYRQRTLAAVSAALLLVVTVSVSGVVVQTLRATRQRRVTEARLHDIVQLTGSLEGELYDSLRPLPRGQAAAASLLQAATASLDSLTAEDGEDAQLALEIGRQYHTLAMLQALQPGQGVAAQQDVAKGIAVLQHVRSSNAAYGAARQEIASLGKIKMQ